MSKPENPVPGYKHLLIEPYTPTLGALVHDFDLASIEDAGARGELRRRSPNSRCSFSVNRS
jgi:hypothetical protein